MVAGYCQNCRAELYEGTEIVTDGETCFCDWSCAREYVGIEEVDYEKVAGEVCFECGDSLEEGYEAFIDGNGFAYCCQECAEHRNELTEEILEV